jgi:hypothetical protein
MTSYNPKRYQGVQSLSKKKSQGVQSWSWHYPIRAMFIEITRLLSPARLAEEHAPSRIVCAALKKHHDIIVLLLPPLSNAIP